MLAYLISALKHLSLSKCFRWRPKSKVKGVRMRITLLTSAEIDCHYLSNCRPLVALASWFWFRKRPKLNKLMLFWEVAFWSDTSNFPVSSHFPKMTLRYTILESLPFHDAYAHAEHSQISDLTGRDSTKQQNMLLPFVCGNATEQKPVKFETIHTPPTICFRRLLWTNKKYLRISILVWAINWQPLRPPSLQTRPNRRLICFRSARFAWSILQPRKLRSTTGPRSSRMGSRGPTTMIRSQATAMSWSAWTRQRQLLNSWTDSPWMTSMMR